MKIGVFDSGIGGQRIAKLLQLEFPDYQIINVSDKENLPYGTKNKQQLISLVMPKIKNMEEDGCDLIVIACNTVTTNLITDIRSRIKIPIVGFEPMIKPAAKHTKTGTITVCATPATVNSQRYAYLKNKYAKEINVLEPDCSEWADLIENNSLNSVNIQKIVDITKTNKADVLVLGCTHYHWIEQLLYDRLGGKVIILQPEEAIIRRIKILIKNP